MAATPVSTRDGEGSTGTGVAVFICPAEAGVKDRNALNVVGGMEEKGEKGLSPEVERGGGGIKEEGGDSRYGLGR